MSRLADEVRKTFSSMHVSRNFRLFFVGQLISVSGTWVNATALAVLVLKLTDSGIALGPHGRPALPPGAAVRRPRREPGGSLRQAPDPVVGERRLRGPRRDPVRAGGDGCRRDLDGVRDRAPVGVDPGDRAPDASVLLRRAGRGPAHHERDQPEQRRVHRHAGARRRDRRDDDPPVRPLVAVPARRGLLRRRDRGSPGDADQ